MNLKVMFTHSNKSDERQRELREGRLVYRHPKRRFVVLEFWGKGGKFREAFWPDEIVRGKPSEKV